MIEIYVKSNKNENVHHIFSLFCNDGNNVECDGEDDGAIKEAQ